MPIRGISGQALPLPEFPLLHNSNVAGCYEDSTADRALSCICQLKSLPLGTKNGSIASVAIAIFQNAPSEGIAMGWAHMRMNRSISGTVQDTQNNGLKDVHVELSDLNGAPVEFCLH